MTRYISQLGPFMLTRLAVIVLGGSFVADIVALEGRRAPQVVGVDSAGDRAQRDFVSLEHCEMCREPFHPKALNGEPYGRICEDCYWSLQT